MTDRELLELAAKAAGYIVQEHVANGAWVYEAGSAVDKDGEPKLFLWRPQDDDGDALRLAVKLWITLGRATLDGKSQFITASEDKLDGEIWEPIDQDPYAATRRAIVRAAAEIGRNVP